MKRRFLLYAVVALAAGCSSAAPPSIRHAAVAGSFYPADPKELARMVDDLLSRAPAQAVNEPVVALVSPHAGYVYSGAVAAHGYALLKGKKIQRVVVIAPSHVDAFPFAAVYDGDAYETPLGAIPVDRAFAAKLAGGSLVRLSSRGHVVSGERGEHSIEVQLPFLQRTLGQFQLVPIIMGDQSYEISRALGVALASRLQGTDTLIVASSDLSHFHPYDDAVTLDRKTLRAIQEWDYLSMSQNFESRVWEACGGGPIVAAMIASERLGANQARLLKYANSGDVTGDRSSVVGYGSLAFVKSPKPAAAAQPFSLTEAEKQELIRLARRSTETAVRDRKLADYSPAGSDSFAQERGAFVTLKENGKLRGCIGYVSPLKPLGITVRDVAAFAAVNDHRFPPVTPAELGSLEYEISVLSPLRRIFDVKQIQVGLHGLVIKQGDSLGLLLPQVPVEEGWDRMTFLRSACQKAGLPPEAWQDPGTDIFVFTALVFGEHQPPARH
ncbi:MAG: AmmeMemoRadiSam system protein B [Bryobacteraceae bacterium]|jgi:AmmeMemoRadiSam system protein B/AmmeMemoRadiSam system protein A